MNAGPALARGILAGDFRIERVLRRMPGAVVYEATQVSLRRRVTLTVIVPPQTADEQFVERFGRDIRLLAGLEHPHIATVIAAGRLEQGLFLATRLVAGWSLADRKIEDRSVLLDLLGHVANALDGAHSAGLVHRAIEPARVVVCGSQAYLTDFPLGRRGGGIADDRVAFATVLQALLGVSLRTGVESRDAVSLVAEAAAVCALPELPVQAFTSDPVADSAAHRRRWRALAAAAAGVAAVAIVAGGFAERPPGLPAPSLPPAARSLGSNLAPGAHRAVDCTGAAPSSSSPSCTVMQASLPGRTIHAERSGVVVAWTVRGARGDMALQVVRPGRRGYTDVARSAFVHVPDHGTHRFGVDLPIRRGDRIAVELRPGAGIGVRDAPVAASTERWIARLVGGPRPPSHLPYGSFDQELLVAAAYVPGRKRQTPAQLIGRRAARAPSGRTLASVEQELPGGEVRELRAVRLADLIVLDLLAGDSRVARLEVPDAHPAGGLLALVKEDGKQPGDTQHILRWQNPGASEPLVHAYRVERGHLELID